MQVPAKSESRSPRLLPPTPSSLPALSRSTGLGIASASSYSPPALLQERDNPVDSLEFEFQAQDEVDGGGARSPEAEFEMELDSPAAAASRRSATQSATVGSQAAFSGNVSLANAWPR